MFPITMLTVSSFLVSEPQESSVQLPNCFMLQKVGCLLTKKKTWHFLPTAPTVRASYNINKASTAFPRERHASYSCLFSPRKGFVVSLLFPDYWRDSIFFALVWACDSQYGSWWLFKFKLIKIKLKRSFSVEVAHLKCSFATILKIWQRACDQYVGPHRYITFPSLQKVFLDGPGLELSFMYSFSSY